MAGETINRNDPRTQLPPVLTVRPASTFFRDHFFSGSDEYFPTENVEWDKVLEGAPMARFVGDDLTVEATERATFSTDEIKTPIMQERRIIGAKDIARRTAGENIFSPKTEAQRAQELHADDLKFCLNSIDNRIENMCAEFMINGRVDILGLGVKREINYFHPNREALLGNDRWGQPNGDIHGDLCRKAEELGHLGYTVDEVFMSPETWRIMYQDTLIQKLLDIRNFEFGSFKPEQVSKYGAARAVGFLSDPFVTIYTQNAEYGPRGGRRRQLPIGTVIFSSPEARQNKLGYGAVTYMDENENWVTVSGRYIQQFFKERRPPREEVLVTSRAVPIPGNIESWAILKAH